MTSVCTGHASNRKFDVRSKFQDHICKPTTVTTLSYMYYDTNIEDEKKLHKHQRTLPYTGSSKKQEHYVSAAAASPSSRCLCESSHVPASEAVDARALQHVIDNMNDATRRLNIRVNNAHLLVDGDVGASGARLHVEVVVGERVEAVAQTVAQTAAEDRCRQQVVAHRLRTHTQTSQQPSHYISSRSTGCSSAH